MKEIVSRRYSRVIQEGGALPNLIVIDGGKGQLHAACDALNDLGLYGQIPIIGIAKRLEEIYFPEDSEPIHFNKKSPALILVQQIRNEAHRFAITFHRNKRSKQTFTSELLGIKGIGKATGDTLLKKFKSVKNIMKATFEELSEVIGESKARIITDYTKNEKGA